MQKIKLILFISLGLFFYNFFTGAVFACSGNQEYICKPPPPDSDGSCSCYDSGTSSWCGSGYYGCMKGGSYQCCLIGPGTPTGGWTCFAAGTKVTSDKGDINIEDVKIGDRVISQSENGQRSTSIVTGLDQPVREHMCRLDFSNGSTVKLTEEHPLMTQDGWKALDPNKTKNENPDLKVGKLVKGDVVVRENGVRAELQNISCWSAKTQAYNLILGGTTHTYFADGFLAHNKGYEFPTCSTGMNLTCASPEVSFPINYASTCAVVFPSKVITASGEACQTNCNCCPAGQINICDSGTYVYTYRGTQKYQCQSTEDAFVSGGTKTPGSCTYDANDEVVDCEYVSTCKHCGCSGTCAPATTAPTNLSISQANVYATVANITWTPGNKGPAQLLRIGENLDEVNSGCYGSYTPACILSTSFPTYTSPASPVPLDFMWYFDKDPAVNGCVKTSSQYTDISTCENNLATYITTPPYPNGTGPRSTGICYTSESDCNYYNQHSVTVNNLESGKTYWVRVVNYKSLDCRPEMVLNYTSICTSTWPNVPGLNAPGNGISYAAPSGSQNVPFSWTAPADWGIECWGTTRSYALCVGPNAADPCSGGAVYNTSDATNPATNYTASVPKGSSYWRVRAGNKVGLTSNFSETRSICVEGFVAGGAGATGSPYLSDWGACNASTHKRTRTCTEDCGTDNCTAAAAAGLLSEDCLGVVSGTLFDASDLSTCPSPIPPELVIPNGSFGFSDIGAGGTHPWSPLTSPIRTNGSGNYSLSVYAPSTYTYDFTGLGGSYVVSGGPKLNCGGAAAGVSGSLSSCLTQPCTTLSGMNFGFWRIFGGWWQASGGSVHAEKGLKSEIPASLPTEQSLILPDATAGNRRGFLSYGVPRPVNIFGTNPAAKVSTSLWEKESKYEGQVYDWSFYNTRFNLFTKTAWAEGQPIDYTGDTNGLGYQIFKTEAPVTTFNYSPGPNEFVIFHVNGDVKVTGNITVPVGSFLAIIAKGTITFDPSITRADGWYVANSIAVPCTDLGGDGCDKTDSLFQGNGSFIGWNGFALGRMRGLTNNTAPSEKFTYRQDLFQNAPKPMRIYSRYFKPFVP